MKREFASSFETETLEEKRDEGFERLQQELDLIKKDAITNGKLFYGEKGEFEYALAPNGEKSHLDEKQWLETRTSFFKDWFGDWEKLENIKRNKDLADEKILQELEGTVSKLVDDNGEPLVVYHGTQGDFETFLPDGVKKFSGNYFAKELRIVIDYAGLGPSLKEEKDSEKYMEYYDTLSNEVKEKVTQRKIRELEKITTPVELNYQESNRTSGFLERREAQQFKEKYKKTIFFWTKKRYLELFKYWMKRAKESESYKRKPNIIPAYLKMVNPIIIDNASNGRNRSYGNFENDVREAKKDGRDGIVWLRTVDGGYMEGTVLNVFGSHQIKSAIENSGFFSNDSENIYE